MVFGPFFKYFVVLRFFYFLCVYAFSRVQKLSGAPGFCMRKARRISLTNVHAGAYSPLGSVWNQQIEREPLHLSRPFKVESYETAGSLRTI